MNFEADFPDKKKGECNPEKQRGASNKKRAPPRRVFLRGPLWLCVPPLVSEQIGFEIRRMENVILRVVRTAPVITVD